MRRGPLACALLPVACLFRLLTAARRGLYAAGLLQSTRMPVPVIVVGNIFVGGTGKTPLTIWLVDALTQAGYRPGVISRGYGADNGTPHAVRVDSTVRTAGDEPLLIAQRTLCPVMIGRNRVATAAALLRTYPEVDLIVSDDGLQHYALQRDVEIVLSDVRGNGNGWLLPAGPLREPVTRRRDFTVVNVAQGVAIPAGAMRMQLSGEHAEHLSDRSQSMPLSAFLQPLAGTGEAPRITAAAGIGNPARFFAVLRAAGLAFAEMPLPDHHDFTDDTFASTAADVILITEKDAVKCAQTERLKNDPRLWVVPVRAQVDRTLLEQIVEKIHGHSIA